MASVSEVVSREDSEDDEDTVVTKEDEKSQQEQNDACSLEHLSQGVSFPRQRMSCRLGLNMRSESSQLPVYLAMFSTTIDKILCFWVLIR